MKKQIENYPNYDIYSDGRIYSKYYNRFMKPSKKRTGYLEVSLTNKDGAKFFSVHRLVADAFCKKPGGCCEVNHIDGNKENNSYENLEWVEHNANLKHAYESGLRKQDVSHKKVKATDMETGITLVFQSIYKAARALKISQGNICMCCQGKRPYANGFYWEYIND